jgi:hypothetical protein
MRIYVVKDKNMISNGNSINLVVGLGETGGPLLEILKLTYPTIGRDIEPVEVREKITVLHICFPFQVGDFIQTTCDYIHLYRPEITIIHSTVIPGTTRKIFEAAGGLIAYSPIRGKHTRMQEDLLYYTKFIAGMTPEAGALAGEYLKQSGFKIKLMETCDGLEAAKLIETTYFGLLIAWSQEIERFGKTLKVDYEALLALTEEVDYLPPVNFQPGYIGGHCIIPNINLLKNKLDSPFLDLILASNDLKKHEWLQAGKDLSVRIAPTTKKLNM